ASGPDPLAALADAARLAVRRAIRAIQRHRDHARGRRLPDPAGAGEEVRVRGAPARDGRLERLRDVVLVRDLTEAARTVATGECGTGHGLVERSSRRGFDPSTSATHGPCGARTSRVHGIA